MADYAIHDTTLTGISNVIRKKDGTSALIDPADYADRINLMGMLEEKTVSGAIATFADGADAVPLKGLVANLPASLTPYEEVKIKHIGKNLIETPTFDAVSLCFDFGKDITVSNIAFSFVANGTISATNTAALIDYRKEDGTHGYKTLAAFYDDNNIRWVNNTPQNGRFSAVSQNMTFRYIYIYYTTSRLGYSAFNADNITNWQVEIGSSASDYEPYQTPTTYEVEIPNPNPNLRPSADIDDGMWTTNGTINPSSGGGFGRALTMAVSEKTSYDIYGLLDNLVVYLDSNKTMLSYERLSNTSLSLQNERKTTPANCAYIGLSALAFDVSSVSVKESFLVYGGTADVVSGQGESKCGKIVFDGSSDENWTAYAGGNGYLIAVADMERGTWYTSELAESYPLPKVPDNNSLGVRIGVNNNGVYVVQANTISGVTDLASFKAYLAENPLTVIYPLDDSETFTFNPVPIDSKLGNNTLWSEQGSDTEVTYRGQGTAYPLPATLVTKTITENGTYSAEDDDADGYSEVTVNVPTGGEEIPFTHVFTAGTATDQYYTATEDGIYLAVGIRDQSIGCSINLPDGGTTILTSSLLSSRAQMKVVQLTTGQRIHLYLYDSSHMRGGWIFKLNTTTPTLAYSNGYSSASIPNHGTTDKVLSVIALAPTTDNTTIWDKTMMCYVRGTYSVSNRYSWLRLMYGIDSEMPTISFSGGIGGQWLINLG